MAILIDGYNLLHASDVFCDAVGPGSVEKLHHALIDALIEWLDPDDVPRTTIVFDSKGRHAGSRRVHRYRSVTVHYSARTEEADLLLDELIQAQVDPRQLTVVSSDHQVQRSARRRQATAVDSEVWYAELRRRHRARQRSPTSERPRHPESVSFPPEVRSQAESELSQGHPFPPDYLADIQTEFLAGPRESSPTKKPGDRREQ